MSILEQILDVKREEIAALGVRRVALRSAAERAGSGRGLARALSRAGEVTVIAEFKRRSPSAGAIRADADPAAVADSYASAGAAALSVLTDETFFAGSLEDLERARNAVAIPVLRKDFVLDEAQLWEARAAGADAALLIVRALDDAELTDLLAAAAAVGLDALVEVHDEHELGRALSAGATLVGANNRDLATFETDLAVSLRLASETPAEVVFVAESGIRTAGDVARLGEAGVDAILVGEAAMRSSAGIAPLVGVRKGARAAGAGAGEPLG